MARPQVLRPRRDLLVEGRDVAGPQWILNGWAARVRILPDGRRQFLNFLLPGDLVGLYHHSRPISPTTIVTLTEVTVCVPPALGSHAMLDEAYAVSHALDEAHLLAQIARLGRMNAMERIGDLMLELHERLSLSELTQGRSYELPITRGDLGRCARFDGGPCQPDASGRAARRRSDLVDAFDDDPRSQATGTQGGTGGSQGGGSLTGHSSSGCNM